MMQADQEKSTFINSVTELLKRVEYRVIKNADDYKEVFELRYNTYVGSNIIAEHMSKMSIDRFDILNNSRTFGVYLDNRLVASLRTHYVKSTDRNCPAMDLFPDVLAPMLEEGETFIDGSKFCVEQKKMLESSALPFLTLRIGYMAALHFETTRKIFAIRKAHTAFYKRYFGAHMMVPPREVEAYDFPVYLYGCVMKEVIEKIEARLPFMKSSVQERAMLFDDSMAEQGVQETTGYWGSKITNRRGPAQYLFNGVIDDKKSAVPY